MLSRIAVRITADMQTHAHGRCLGLALCAAIACGDSKGDDDTTQTATSLTSASASATATATMTASGSTGTTDDGESTAPSVTTGPDDTGPATVPDPDTSEPDPTTVSTTNGPTGPDDTTAGESTSGEPSEYFMLSDSLIGMTMGTQVGGSFGDSGWTVAERADRIYWSVPRLVEGSVEFTVANITMANIPLNDHEIFAMYEGGYDIEHPIKYSPDFRNNSFKSMIRIYGVNEGPERVGKQKIMWGICPFGAPGHHDGGCPCVDPPGFFEEPFGGDQNWDGSPQRLRVEWKDGVTRFLRNGGEVLTIEWAESGQTFGPEDLYISLGNPRPLEVDSAGMPIGAVFSDVVIEGWTGPASATCGI